MTALDPGEAKDTPALFPEELLIGRPLRAATIGGRFAVLKLGDSAASREITNPGAPSATIERCQIAGSGRD